MKVVRGGFDRLQESLHVDCDWLLGRVRKKRVKKETTSRQKKAVASKEGRVWGGTKHQRWGLIKKRSQNTYNGQAGEEGRSKRLHGGEVRSKVSCKKKPGQRKTLIGKRRKTEGSKTKIKGTDHNM